MALKDTAKKMGDLLEKILSDLGKANNGNKAAAQRVRTQSIKLEKVAKVYRKESISAEKSGLMNRKSATKKTTGKRVATSKKVLKASDKSMRKVVKAKKRAPAATKKCSSTTKKKKIARRSARR